MAAGFGFELTKDLDLSSTSEYVINAISQITAVVYVITVAQIFFYGVQN